MSGGKRKVEGLKLADDSTYTGEINEAGQPDGQGFAVLWHGEARYEGGWRNGKRHGRGVEIQVDNPEDGMRLEGEWFDEGSRVRGVMTWDGQRLEGEFLFGSMPVGRFVHTKSGGARIEGSWEGGPVGNPVWIDPDGSRFKAVWGGEPRPDFHKGEPLPSAVGAKGG